MVSRGRGPQGSKERVGGLREEAGVSRAPGDGSGLPRVRTGTRPPPPHAQTLLRPSFHCQRPLPVEVHCLEVPRAVRTGRSGGCHHKKGVWAGQPPAVPPLHPMWDGRKMVLRANSLHRAGQWVIHFFSSCIQGDTTTLAVNSERGASSASWAGSPSAQPRGRPARNILLREPIPQIPKSRRLVLKTSTESSLNIPTEEPKLSPEAHFDSVLEFIKQK